MIINPKYNSKKLRIIYNLKAYKVPLETNNCTTPCIISDCNGTPSKNTAN